MEEAFKNMNDKYLKGGARIFPGQKCEKVDQNKKVFQQWQFNIDLIVDPPPGA